MHLVPSLPIGVRLKNGYIEARLQWHGKSVTKYFGKDSPKSRQAARIWRLRHKLRAATNTYQPEGLERRITIAEACSMFERLHGPSLKSPLKPFVDRIAEEWSGRYLDSITPLDIRDFRAKFKNPCSANRYHAVVSSMYNRLEEWSEDGTIPKIKLPAKNPGEKWPKADDRPYIRTRVLSPEEWDRFMVCAPERLKRTCEWLLVSSLRRGDAKKGAVAGIQGKTGRRFDTGAPAPEALDWTNFRKEFRAACKAANVKDLRPHDLRRTGPSWMMKKGVPLPVLQKILGHASIMTTMRYLNVNQDDTRKALETLYTGFKVGVNVGVTQEGPEAEVVKAQRL